MVPSSVVSLNIELATERDGRSLPLPVSRSTIPPTRGRSPCVNGRSIPGADQGLANFAECRKHVLDSISLFPIGPIGMIEEHRKAWSEFWHSITSQVSRHPLMWYASYLVFELWLLSGIPHNILSDSLVARAYVNAIAALSPVIHRFDSTAEFPEVISFFLAISVLLVVPKILFCVGWLRSDKFGVYRYFVISPLTSSAPKSAVDFVKDAGLG